MFILSIVPVECILSTFQDRTWKGKVGLFF